MKWQTWLRIAAFIWAFNAGAWFFLSLSLQSAGYGLIALACLVTSIVFGNTKWPKK